MRGGWRSDSIASPAWAFELKRLLECEGYFLGLVRVHTRWTAERLTAAVGCGIEGLQLLTVIVAVRIKFPDADWIAVVTRRDAARVVCRNRGKRELVVISA